MRLAKGHAQELAEAQCDVVGKPIAVQQRDHVVVIGREAGLRHLGQIVGQRLTLVGQDQPRLVQAVATQHAAHGIAHQLTHGVGQQQGFQLFFALVAAVAVMRVAGERDLVQGYLGRQLILQAIGVDEDAVVLFLQALHFQCHLAPVDAELLVAGLERRLAIVGLQQREAREVPRDFIGVPISL